MDESGDQLRIGLLSVYFGLFDDAMPAEFREGRERFSEKLRSLLSLHGEVTYPGLVDSEAAGETASEAFAKAQAPFSGPKHGHGRSQAENELRS